MSKITLNNVGSLIDSTTAANTINNNTAVIQAAFDNTLSRDGTSPNTMLNILDMNSNQVLNLPAPATAGSPLRLQDLSTFVGGGTVTNIPVGGTTGQVLAKTSNTNYATGWANSTSTVTSVGLSLPGDFTVTNSPVTTTGTLTGVWTTTPTGTGAVVRTLSPTVVTPAITNPTVSTGTFTSPTLITPALGAATATSINASTVSPGHYSGEPSTGSAVSGEIGEYITATQATPQALTTATPLTITSISLTAGDWDVSGTIPFVYAATTIAQTLVADISLTNNTLDATTGRLNSFNFGSAGITPNGGFTMNTPTVRLSLSTTTTVYLVAQSNFTTSTATAAGIIRARRAR